MNNLQEFLEHYTIDQTQSLDPKGGSVYQGVETATNSSYAIKWSETHPKFDRQLLPERHAQSKALDHPNLLPYLQHFRFEEQTIVDIALLPLIADKSLAEQDHLTDADKRLILEQLLDALTYLHAHGVVWQYLSASHILLEPSLGNWIPRIIHYGHPQKVPLPYFSDWEYLAPEQLEETAPIDARTDIWALGVLIHQLWTGRLPFGQKSASLTNATIGARIAGEEDWALGLLEKIPMPYQKIVERCLKRDPNARWENCGQIIAALQNWTPVGGLAHTASNNTEALAEPSRSQRFARRKPSKIIWWQVPLWLLLAAALGYWLGQLG